MAVATSRKLFEPTQVGPIPLSHRVVMSPLTLLRAEVPGDIPGPLMAEYYRQRASEGGLIISEATTVSMRERGYLGAPGIYSDAQVVGWRKVVDAVHAKGGRIVLQLLHVGRVGHVDMTGGVAPLAPSVVPFEGIAYIAEGWVPVSPHRAIALQDIPGIVDEYRSAAKRARAAGFDGVEIHAGNGYLLDQFLQDGSNKRTDAYGGSVENRARLLFEVVRAVACVWGRARVGVRISPGTIFNGMSDSSPGVLFCHVADRLDEFGIAYLHIIEPRSSGNESIAEGLPPIASELLRKHFAGTIIAAGGFEPETPDDILARGDADLVAFGRHFSANPDLPRRIKLGLPLNAYDRSTSHGGDHRRYIDFPCHKGGAEI